MSDAHPAETRSRTNADGDDDRASLERQLAEKRASIGQRIDELESEIVSAPAAILSAVKKHPFFGIAGAVAAGLAVGLLLTRKRKPEAAPFHQRLVEQYIDAVGEDVRYRMRRGRTIQDAVREALRNRAPVILYAPERERERESKGFFKQLGDIALKTALGFTVKTAIDLFTSRLDVEELQRLLVLEQEKARAGADAESPGTANAAAGTADAATETP